MNPHARSSLCGPSLNDVELARGELLLARILDFARFLWELGLDIGPGRMVELVESLPLIDIGVREEFYTFLKVSLVSKREQLTTFDDAFAYFWHARLDARDDLQTGAQMRRRSLALPSHRMPEQDKAQERLTLPCLSSNAIPTRGSRRPRGRHAARKRRTPSAQAPTATRNCCGATTSRSSPRTSCRRRGADGAAALAARRASTRRLRPRVTAARSTCAAHSARACAPAASRSPYGGASCGANRARSSSSATSAAR